MKPFQANLLNAIALIALGLWGYFSADPELRSGTALIAPAFGLILLLCTPGVRNENKVIAHVAVLLTLLLIIMLAVKPLPSRIEAGDQAGMIRIVIMQLTGMIALISFIRSFISARKAREAGRA